jgi:putative DNA primase/helicase
MRVEAPAVFDDGVIHPVEKGEVNVEALQLTVAEAFVQHHGKGLAWNVEASKWHKFDGAIWKESPFKEGYELARRWALVALNSPQMTKGARQAVAKSAFYEGVETIMRSALAVTGEMFDQDDWLLGTPSGTVDLRTGVLRAADPLDMISLSCSTAPSAKEDCPKWLRFIDWACTDGLGKWTGRW